MTLAVPLTGCVTLSKSLNLPEAAAKCGAVKREDGGFCVLFLWSPRPPPSLSLLGWLL